MGYIKPNPPQFLNLLSEVFQDEEAQRQKEGVTTFRHHPSSASFKKLDGTVVGACLRQLYYRATNVPESDPKELTTKLQGLFGDGIHDKLVSKWAKSNKIKIRGESSGRIKVTELENEISFRLDGLVSHQAEEGGLEIKTMQSFAVQRMIKEGGPREKDILQILTYFYANESIKWFSLVYFGRDTAYRAEYHIYRDESGAFIIEGIIPKKTAKPIEELTVEGVLSRWKELEEYKKANKVPPRDFKAVLTKDGKLTDKRTKNYVDYSTDWTCKYCSWATHCWSLPDAKDHAYKVPGD